MTWSGPTRDPALVEPGCQASLIRADLRADRTPVRLLFSNPAGDRRSGMAVKLSEDAGKTWPVVRVLHPGPSAYSCLTVLPDRTFGCLYERGEKQPYERITFAGFDRDWLEGGAVE